MLFMPLVPPTTSLPIPVRKVERVTICDHAMYAPVDAPFTVCAVQMPAFTRSYVRGSVFISDTLTLSI